MTDIISLGEYERWDGVFPGNHKFSTLENFDADPINAGHRQFTRDARRLIDAWQGDQFVGMFLHGGPGRGKTHAAIALGRALHDVGADVFFRHAPQLANHAPQKMWSEGRGDKNRTTYDPSVPVQSTQRKIHNPHSKGRVTKYVTSQRKIVSDDKKPERNPNSVFPESYYDLNDRNPKTVLILDDIRPSHHAYVRSAVEAAAHFGGALIITSNFGNMGIYSSPTDAEMSSRPAPGYGVDEAAAARMNQAYMFERTRLEEAFMSRIAGNVAEIEFGGNDLRQQSAFWADSLDPNDFI